MPKTLPKIKIRKATIEDAKLIFQFVKALAVYEKAEEEVIATEEDIIRNLFGNHTTNEAIICTLADNPIGFAVYFQNFSTWLGRNGLYLEDLYIIPNCRGLGAGKKMLQYLAKIAVKKKYGRIEWSVLNWNETAIKFYKSIGAKAQDEWTVYRLDGQSLLDFANSEKGH